MGPIVSLFVTSLGQVIDWLLAIQKNQLLFGPCQNCLDPPIVKEQAIIIIYFNPKCARVKMNSLWSILVHIVHIVSLFHFPIRK